MLQNYKRVLPCTKIMYHLLNGSQRNHIETWRPKSFNGTSLENTTTPVVGYYSYLIVAVNIESINSVKRSFQL